MLNKNTNTNPTVTFGKRIGDTPTDALQLVNKKYVDDNASSVFPGAVSNSTSAGTPFPSGWTVSNNTTGVCTITHNLGTINYAVSILPQAGDIVPNIQSKGANSFQVRTDLNATTPSNTSFDFIVAPA